MRLFQILVSKEFNFFGGHGIVGGQIPLGAGLAFADKYLEKPHVTLTYMGDGAVRQGSFHETLNLAALWNLPVVFVIENNEYAMGTSVSRSAREIEMWKFGHGYGIPSAQVDGMDPVKVYEGVHEAVERARNGEGPSLLEIKTYRYKGHSMSDAQHYRTKEEVAEYQKIDPITTTRDVVLKKKYATEKQLEEIDQRVKERVNECVKFAEESPFPQPEDLFADVYKQSDYPFIKE
jgi:pyruvate dehydrogenase E1 component alpha subunit